jgi:hypothetical protein
MLKQQFLSSRQIVLLVLVAAVFSVQAVTFAQVTLTIPTDDIFTSINAWIVTFVPVVAIGIGIAAALAILGFVGKQIIKAFNGGGK